MSFWPWVVVFVLVGVASEYALQTRAEQPQLLARTQVVGLLDYCQRVRASLQANPTQAAGQIAQIGTITSTLYSNYATGVSGSPARTLQCWLNTALANGQTAGAIQAVGAGVNLGTATSKTQWASASTATGLAAQTLPQSVSAAQVGTVVVLTGY